MPAKKEKSFEENMDRLEEIIQSLEENTQPLDTTISLFEEGLQLVKNCDDKLKDFETKVEEIRHQNGVDHDED